MNVSSFKVGQKVICTTLNSRFNPYYDEYTRDLGISVGEPYTVYAVNPHSSNRTIKVSDRMGRELAYWLCDDIFSPLPAKPLTRDDIAVGTRLRCVTLESATYSEREYDHFIHELNIQVGSEYTLDQIYAKFEDYPVIKLLEPRTDDDNWWWVPIDLFELASNPVATLDPPKASPAPIGPPASEILALLKRVPDPKKDPLAASKALADIIDSLDEKLSTHAN